MGLWATSNGKSLITAATLILLPLFLSFVITRLRPQIQDQNIVTEVSGVKIERNPSQSKLDQLGVTAWRTWEGSPSKFPWTFTAKETMFLLDGKVKVYCDGSDESFEIGAGDLVEFPKGMKVIWEVTQAVKKHYYLEK